jgi:hypothetical protein
MRRYLTAIPLFFVPLLAYLWANAFLPSLDSYRSPLKDNPPQPGPSANLPLTRRVVIVLVDGLRSDVAHDTQVMPNLARYRSQWGDAILRSRAPSYSAPAYGVIFTGAWQDISDGPANNLGYDQFWPWTQDNLFAMARRAGLKTGVAGFYWFERFITPENRSMSVFVEGEDEAADQVVLSNALAWLDDPAYALVLIHLDQVDHAGHDLGGGSSQAYRQAASRVDAALQQVTAKLDWSRDTLLVFSDHGHIDRGGHGGAEAVVTTQPLVMVGAGVRPWQAPAVLQQVDIAPTVAVLLGLPLPASAQGQPFYGGLDLNAAQAQAVQTAWLKQQAELRFAYQDATGLAELNLAPRRPERVLSAVVLLGLLIWVLWKRRGPNTIPLIQSTLVYALVFHILFAVLLGRSYSISWVDGPEDMLLNVLPVAGAAFLGAAAFLYQRMRRLALPFDSQAVLRLGWAVIILLALPLLAHLGWNGPWPTTYLPEMTTFFIALMALVQMVGVAPLALLGGLLVGLNKARLPRPQPV